MLPQRKEQRVKIRIYCDATFNPKTKVSYIAYCDKTMSKYVGNKKIKCKDNNQAELEAILFAIAELEKVGIKFHEVEIFTDSKDALAKYSGNFSVTHLPRDQNLGGQLVRINKENKET